MIFFISILSAIFACSDTKKGTSLEVSMDAEFAWDFFIAHAGPDLEIARQLYLLLKDRSRVFLDYYSVEPGSNWDTSIATAQAQSRVTVVLVSTKTTEAYYQREEIAAAIDLARKDADSHKVVPVFTDSESITSKGLPYGLRIKHGLTIGADLSLALAADRLMSLIAQKGGPSGSATIGREQDQPFHPDLIDPWSANPGEVLRQILLNQQNQRSRSAELHWKAAVLFARMHRSTEAVEALELGDSIGSNEDKLRILYAGFVYLRVGRRNEGENLLREFIGQDKTQRREAAIAFDLLGTELRRQLKITEAEDRFKSALRLKKKVNDFAGQGITLGNLGRISLYSMRPHDAIAYFQKNVTITQEHAQESVGIARNNLAEAYVVANQVDSAVSALEPMLNEPERFSPRDRGFSQVVVAEGLLSSRDFEGAAKALNRATTEFEKCVERNGLFLVEELEGLLALSKGWGITAEKHFESFDTKLKLLGDHLFSVYRWRRRAFLATLQSNEKTVVDALESARKAAISAGLPSEDIDIELREFRKLTQGTEPTLGSKPWFVYWQTRSPVALASALGMVEQHPLGFFLLAERACEFFEAMLSEALGVPIKPPERRSFGSKVQGLRAMARQWCTMRRKSTKKWDELLRGFDAVVEMRNRTVHSSPTGPKVSNEEVLPHIETFLRFASLKTRLLTEDVQCDTGGAVSEETGCDGAANG
jgi:tetratricopeptide (TPR) repeat protein